MKLSVTFFPTQSAFTKTEGEYEFEHLVPMIFNSDAKEKDRLPWLKLARFGWKKTAKGSLRHDSNVIAVSGCEVDYDNLALPDMKGPISFGVACEILRDAGILGIVYTSANYSATVFKWRILCPFSREIEGELAKMKAQRVLMVARLHGLYGGIFDPGSFDLSRSFYYGSVNNNPLHQVEFIDGTPLDLHTELDRGALGRSHGAGPGKHGYDGPRDEAGLIEQIVSTKAYHDSAVDLAVSWAIRGVSAAEASRDLHEIFERVPTAMRDQRWKDRVAELPAILKWSYHREAEKPANQRKMKMNGSTPHPESEADPGRAHGDWREPITEPPSPSRLTLRFGFDATHPVPMGTVVKGLLHAGSLTLFYGPPKSGKSFLLTDLFLVIAAAQADWLGHKVVRPGPVLYVACEGHAGFWKRLKAKAKVMAWDENSFPSGFILATGRPVLISFDEKLRNFAPHPDDVLAKVMELREQGIEPVSVAIDTVFRSFGGGNVNDSSHMNAYIEALTRIADLGIAVAIVHHQTKSTGTAAGSVTLIGSADTIIRTGSDPELKAEKWWEVEAAKDDASTDRRAFTLQITDVGLDLEGEMASSCIVIDGGSKPGDAVDAAVKKTMGRPRDPAKDNIAFAMLKKLIEAKGEDVQDFDNYGQKAIKIGVLRERFYREAMPGEKNDAKRMWLNRWIKGAQTTGFIGSRDDWIWIRPVIE
jgi:hypothetical protein